MLQRAWNVVKRHRWKFLLGGGTVAGVAYLGRRVYVQYKQLSVLLEETEDLDRLLAALLGLDSEDDAAQSAADGPRRSESKKDSFLSLASLSALLERLGLPTGERQGLSAARASQSAEWKMIAHFCIRSFRRTEPPGVSARR
ncbi:hypothetical protein BESB_070670 [Besnoitia besnoiti]|uniref:Peroxin-3 n=1 Tax=Besnoitia besnoiti TaxID=94643 RepID=A0A2A9M7E9_BESBE|nr:uncharacterized protein BESB_070670 [Besnoitia besnoiti]PFH33915.1 hypothetical protein BESB_070670 [Besnoitia besnoiti]